MGHSYFEMSNNEQKILKVLLKERRPMKVEEIANKTSLPLDIVSVRLNCFNLRNFVWAPSRNDNVYYELTNFAEVSNILFCDKISQIKKEKNILHFYISNQNLIVDYDFITKSFINTDKLPVIILPEYFSYLNLPDALTRIFGVMNRKLYIPEWIFSYPDLIQSGYNNNNKNFDMWITWLDNLPKTIKKGYLQYCKENNAEIDYQSYRVFLAKSALNTNDKKILCFFARISEGIPRTVDIGDIDFLLLRQTIRTLFKIYRYSTEWSEYFAWSDLSSMAEYIFACPEMLKLLDTNRGIRYNRKTLFDYRDTHLKTLLADSLQKLNFINNVIINDYIIKVPQSLNDLINEGEQQNNCVGHFYNESIITGKDLIYFIRKKSKPQKSFITCRYNINSCATVEARYVNNKNETELEDIHRQIDKMIKEQLKK